MSNQGDWSWSEEALYACPCGSLVVARRWRWLDRQARPELVATLRASGPLVGACSRCRRPATGGGAWLEVDADRGAATLVLSADRRGDLIAALQAHLVALQARPEQAAPWLLQPEVAFVPVPPPWAEEAGEAAPELSPWPGPALGSRAQDSGVRVSEPARLGDEPAGAGARAEETGAKGHVPGARAEEPGSKGHVPVARSAGSGEAPRGAGSGPSEAARGDAVQARRREGSGAVTAAGRRREGSDPAAAAQARRREGSDPAAAAQARRREASGPSEAAQARLREGSGPSEAEARAVRASRGNSESALQDTFPGRRRGRSAEDVGLEEQGSLVSAARRSFEASGQGKPGEPGGRRPGAVLEGTGTNGQDASAMSSGAGRRDEPGGGRRADAAAAGPGEAGGAGRRAGAEARPEAAGASGQDAAGQAAGRRPAAVLEPGDAVRRPGAVLEGTGSNGQDASAMSAGTGRPGDAVRRPAAVIEPGDAVRRPGAVLEPGDAGSRRGLPEGTGSNGQDASAMSSGAGRRPGAVLEPGDAARRPGLEGASGPDAAASGRRPTVALEPGDGVRRPGAVLEPGEANRRPGLSEGTGANGQDASGMSSGPGHRADEGARRPGAVLEGPGEGGARAIEDATTRRPGAVLEGTGANRQEPAAMSAGTGRRDDPGGRRGPEPGAEGDPERSALRAAVARALTPAAPPESGPPRPAAVLPGPAEASAAESSGTWSRRQVEAADAAARRNLEGSDSRQVSEAAITGTWPKRQILEGPADSGPGWRREEEPRTGRPSRAPAPPPVRLGADVQRTALGSLGRDGGVVQLTANVNEATARVWATAPVKVRPIHLRGLGYPLVGVRAVAEAGGEPLVIDAVVDVGEPMTLDLFKQLTREFKIRLALPGTHRELVAPELQRNAASCLESAQAQLGTGEFPPDAYRTARELLTGQSAAQRLEPARTPIGESLAETSRESAAAAWLALERLDQGSRKDNLGRLLEVDGLGVETYEKIRSTVLGAAIEFGLPAPARFWRRWLGSDQARDVGTFVQKLIAARTASIARGEDLDADQAEAAWRGILDLCQHKNLTPPPELSKALGLGKVTTGRRASQPQIKAAAEVREAAPVQEARSQARLRELTARLRGAPADSDVRAVVGSLPELAEADVASLMPVLAELGPRIGPELLACLRAPQRHVRQAAAILLGHLGERKAEGPLVTMLGDEPSGGWVDAARALGNLGPRVVGPLCNLLRSTPSGRKEAVGARVARALAELIKAEGAGPGGSGRVAVENLLEVADPSVSSAARRALATLGAVRDEVDGEEAEASRRFSRLASDAIAPELDAAEDDEVDEVEVEVGD
ncbi:hypothetical protein [Nannocystis bainbridge]|uniref:HEAT repeat protein n=1 Tax=Nannocystis bainbridge TaxID=2995303 RepID=A0ABT5EDI1_9BACT|nr:hypothetical protein [Nannocystis bainbridge]MDC0722836.1 hypothetical protein [Nannocystis bainbridge]